MKSQSKFTVTEVSSLIIGIVFFGSILYNIAFFKAFGINTNNIPITARDVINTFLSWIESGIYSALASYGFAEVAAFTDKDIPEEKLQCSKKMIFFRKSPYYGILLILLLIPIFIAITYPIHGILFRAAVNYYGIAFVLILLLIIAKFRRIPKERISDVLFLPESILIIFLTTAFCSGYKAGKFPDKNLPTATINISNKKIDVDVVRMFESGILCQDLKRHRLILYPWKNIVGIRFNNLSIVASKKKTNS